MLVFIMNPNGCKSVGVYFCIMLWFLLFAAHFTFFCCKILLFVV